MKILDKAEPSRKQLLDTVYTCELSGWEIAAITILCTKFAGGNPDLSMRGYCDSVRISGERFFPFLALNSSYLFEGNRFSDDSKKKILENNS